MANTLAAFLEDMGHSLEQQSRTVFDMVKKMREDLGMPAMVRKPTAAAPATKRHRAPTDPNAPKYGTALPASLATPGLGARWWCFF